jgi:tRNA(Ile)-lysidine synthetase-like protein
MLLTGSQFESIQPTIYPDIIISLSGGVDSMVCSYVLWKMTHASALGLRLRAVHINYMNRPETLREEQFVVNWCNELGIECHVRRIDEINRSACRKHGLRDAYEAYTKRVRFAAYDHVQKMGGTDNCAVVLGHNRDDGFENIVTNIKAGIKHNNLRGMGFSCQVDGVVLLRPLHDVNKDDIYAFARLHGIPYLKDTTVSWCSRSTVRTTVAPCIKSFGAYDGFFALADSCQDMARIVSALADNVVAILTETQKIQVPTGHPLLTSLVFSRQVFYKYGGRHVSLKSLSYYLDRIRVFKRGCCQGIVLRRGLSLEVHRCSAPLDQWDVRVLRDASAREKV